jgi:uncharacterized protein YfaQ (DUF2300 family)
VLEALLMQECTTVHNPWDEHTGRLATADPERFDPPTAHNGFSHLQSRDVDAYLGLTAASDTPLASVSSVAAHCTCDFIL